MEALIIGATGQDGNFLTEKLIESGYKTHAVSRNLNSQKTNTYLAKYKDKVSVHTDWLELLKINNITQIYYLAGQSSVGHSFRYPREQFHTITEEYLDILEWVRAHNNAIKIFYAASGECFGDTSQVGPAIETTPYAPRNPYAYSKVIGAQISKMYREIYNLNISIGYLYNHESKLRPEGFVIRKIIDAAKSIKDKKTTMIELGNIHVVRDWGYAGDYVDAIYSIMQDATLEDYIICTGESSTLYELAGNIFEYYGLLIDNHLKISKENIREIDAKEITGNPAKLKNRYNWEPKYTYKNLVEVIL